MASSEDMNTPSQALGTPSRAGMTILGIIMLLGGALAFFNPFAASLTVEFVAGAVFFAAGLVQIWMAFTDKTDALGGRVLGGIIGLFFMLFALSLLVNPIAGLITLTFVVAILFAMLGGVRLVYAFRMRPKAGWGWVAGSGVMSILLALLIVSGLPGAALGILGLFLAIDLTMSGIATLALAWQTKKDD